MKRAYFLVSLSLLSAGWTTTAGAGSYYGRRIIPGVGEGSSVDTYLPNPDPQPPVVWSQGTEPPPPQADFGGGFLQYILTGTERRPAPPRPYRRPLPPGYGQAVFGQGPVAYAAAAPAAAVPLQAAMDPIYRRQEVAFAGPQAPGTIVVDTGNKFLYLVGAGGRALRYGIGVGRPGFLWSGTKTITRKAEWPDWTPPSEMMARRPDLPVHMAGGIGNPLGARAMYLGSTLYRIHGTNEPDTIGTNVSSGCIRLLNEDVADLYARVRVGTRVLVM